MVVQQYVLAVHLNTHVPAYSSAQVQVQRSFLPGAECALQTFMVHTNRTYWMCAL